MESTGLGFIAFLVLFPVVIALLLLVCRNDKARDAVTIVGAAVTAIASIACAVIFLPAGPQQFAVDEGTAEAVTWIALAIDVCLGLYVIGKGIRWKNWIAPLLALVQTVLIVWFELTQAHGVEVAHALYIDELSVIMALIIGIIGSGIAVYALGYMKVHEAHVAEEGGTDRRPVFFAVMFAFLGAMFGIVFFNNMAWMLACWEVTTVCSFALIGYTRTDEAIRNSFRQIILNLIGGLGFACALVYIVMVYGTLELDVFLSETLSYASSGLAAATYAPLLLLALAGFTKAAQFPFQSWLLGAMVAPTPTSALLHSSTMVKAGVFLLIKLAPCLGFNIPGYVVMLVGGATFLFAAFAAISQSNAKRVLAYSTISNLGLIAACAGVGTSGAVWAAIFLVIFHAAAKSLLFLCVGTAEHHIGSRDIESFDDLFERMPRLARLMAIGIMGMFVAPFGMLVSKWAALQSFAESSNVILLMLLVFGSAATFMFWAKWLGKVLAIANSGQEDVETTVSVTEWAALGLMTLLTVGCCIGFPLISAGAVAPYLQGTFEEVADAISTGDLWIMAVIGLVVAVVFLGFKGSTKKRVVPVYMAGVGIDLDNRTFRDSLAHEMTATQRNWYMDELFGEKKVSTIGVAVTLVILLGAGGYVLQTGVPQQDAIASVSAEQEMYRSTLWGQNSANYSDFDQYYQYYNDYYTQNAEQFQQMGIGSIEELLNEIYNELNEPATDTTATDGAAQGAGAAAGEGAAADSSAADDAAADGTAPADETEGE